jgi:hypothetical protein
MIRIFQEHYTDKNAQRQKELELCWSINKDLNSNNGYHYIAIESRETYAEKIARANRFVQDVLDISIICNSDIYFDKECLELIAWNLKAGQVYALSRWDVDRSGTATHFDRPDTADVWCWRGRMRTLEYADFHLGKRGCDNRIAHEFKKAGYEVKNPSKTIKTYHLHNTGVRNYSMRGSEDLIPQPYLMVPTTEI